MLDLEIKVKGLKELQAKFKKLPNRLEITFGQSLRKIFDLMMRDQGGGKPYYPPETEHNRPPVPFYIRGKGEEFGGFNDLTSEQMNTKFYYTPEFPKAYIGNTASYAGDVIGENQKPLFKEIGWMRLVDWVQRHMPQITAAFQDWVDATLKALKL